MRRSEKEPLVVGTIVFAHPIGAGKILAIHYYEDGPAYVVGKMNRLPGSAVPDPKTLSACATIRLEDAPDFFRPPISSKEALTAWEILIAPSVEPEPSHHDYSWREYSLILNQGDFARKARYLKTMAAREHASDPAVRPLAQALCAVLLNEIAYVLKKDFRDLLRQMEAQGISIHESPPAEPPRRSSIMTPPTEAEPLLRAGLHYLGTIHSSGTLAVGDSEYLGQAEEKAAEPGEEIPISRYEVEPGSWDLFLHPMRNEADRKEAVVAIHRDSIGRYADCASRACDVGELSVDSGKLAFADGAGADRKAAGEKVHAVHAGVAQGIYPVFIARSPRGASLTRARVAYFRVELS